MIALEYGIPTDKESPLLRLGIARGFFRDEGIDIRLKTIFGGPEIAHAYDTGALKMGEIGSPPAITAIAKGSRFRLVASNAKRHAVQYFVAAPGVRDWPDMKGKTAAALSIGSCSYWFMRQVLQSHGLDPDADVNVVGLGPRYPVVVDLFRSGELSGAVLSEPNVSIGEGAGVFRVMQALTDAAYCPDMQWGLVVAGADTIAREPELIRAVLRASRRSYAYAAAHRDEWIDFGAEQFDISRETMKRSVEREIGGLSFDGQIDMPGLQQAIDLQVRLGAIEKPLEAEEIVDLRFLANAETVG